MVGESLFSMLWGVILSLLQLVVSLSLATATVYLGLRAFDRTTKGINEMKEIKKGNVAVGILMATIVISIANIVQAGVENLTALIDPTASLEIMSIALLVGVAQLLVVLFAAVFSISVALKVLEKITIDIDEMKELKKGNVAVAILMSGVLLAVSFVIRAGTVGLVKSIDPALISFYLGG